LVFIIQISSRYAATMSHLRPDIIWCASVSLLLGNPRSRDRFNAICRKAYVARGNCKRRSAHTLFAWRCREPRARRARTRDFQIRRPNLACLMSAANSNTALPISFLLVSTRTINRIAAGWLKHLTADFTAPRFARLSPILLAACSRPAVGGSAVISLAFLAQTMDLPWPRLVGLDPCVTAHALLH
jgi:hypothetical protein